MMTDLILTLTGIHPELGAWATDRRDEGMTDADIKARLRTVAFAARPEGDDSHADAFAVTTLIPARMIADLFVTAIEGGSNYWINHIVHKGWKKEESQTKWWYDDTTYVGTDRLHLIVEAEDDLEQHEVKGREAVEKGLAILAAKYPHHMKDIIDDNHDAATADAFFQCVVFGEIVYG